VILSVKGGHHFSDLGGKSSLTAESAGLS
jgi:hypothetical protein